MKFFAFAILTIAIFAFAWADQTCTINGKTIGVGKTYHPSGRCEIVQCEAGGRLTAKTCPALVGGFTCGIVKGDASRPYPSCCDTLNCRPGQ